MRTAAKEATTPMVSFLSRCSIINLSFDVQLVFNVLFFVVFPHLLRSSPTEPLKPNQDKYGITLNLAGEDGDAIFAVYDGTHGILHRVA
jgi:hypothetical protein